MNTNISMTAVYLISGAAQRPETFDRMVQHMEGEQALQRALVEFAPAVERVYQVLNAKHDLGEWLIECVERFGAALLDLVYLPSCQHDYFTVFIDLANCAANGTLTDSDRADAYAAWLEPNPAFLETYKSAWISTVHIKPETLEYLNMLPYDMLPFWVSATPCGWIVRFDAMAIAEMSDEEEGSPALELAACEDLRTIYTLLDAHGLQAAHLDADGPVIDGLPEYAH